MNKQVLVYGGLESANDLRSAFVGHIHFKKLMKLYLLKYFTVAWPGSGTRNKFFLIIFIDENHFNKMKIWDNVILRNLLNSTASVKYFTVAWPDSGTRVWVFLYNANAQEPF